MKKNIFIILWSLSVLMALFIGQSLNNPVSLTQTNEEGIFKADKGKAEGVSSITKKKSILGSEKRTLSTTLSKTQVNVSNVISDLVNYFEKPDDNNSDIYDNYRGMADTWEKLKELDESQLLKVYDQLSFENNGRMNWNVARTLYKRMGELNPVKAIEHAMENGQSHWIREVMNSWSERNPLEALNWLQNNIESYPTTKEVNFSEVFQNVAKTDLKKAVERLKNLNIEGGIQRDALKGILKAVETNEDFIYIINDLKESGDNVSSEYLSYSSNKEPYDAVLYNDNSESSAMKTIGLIWLGKNPTEAADWIISHNENKIAALSTIINGWNSNSDGGDLYKWWVKNQGEVESETRDDVNSLLAIRYSNRNFNVAIKAIDNIASKEMRKAAVTELYYMLLKKNQKRAEEFLNSRDEALQ